MSSNALIMLSNSFSHPQFKLLGIFSLFQTVYFDEKFLHPQIIISAIMVYLLSFFKTLSSLLKFLDKSFILFLVIFNIANCSLQFGLYSFYSKLELIKLLIFVIGNIVQDLPFMLFQSFLYVLWCYFLQERGLTFTDLP